MNFLSSHYVCFTLFFKFFKIIKSTIFNTKQHFKNQKQMKKIVSFFALALILTACNGSTKKEISIENTSKFDYSNKVISITWERLKENYPWVDKDNFKIVNAKSNAEIPYQIEYLGTEKPVNLLLQVSLKSNEKMQLSCIQEKPSTFTTKTYARFVPERFDDFAWENDIIAFRMYGKALELEAKGNAFGMDVWVKRTDRMVLNERYKRGKYHEDNGDGMDYYHVGFTLGAGNCAPFVNDSIWYSKNYSKWNILDNGPLRTTFKLDFDPWDVAGNLISATKTISLDAGSQLNKIEVTYSTDAAIETIPVAMGIIKRPEEGGIEMFNTGKGILGYWEPTHGNDGTTGVGVIIPSKVDDMRLRNDQYLAIAEMPVNKSFAYYAGAAWDKAGVITTNKQWFDFLELQNEQLAKDGIVVNFK